MDQKLYRQACPTVPCPVCRLLPIGSAFGSHWLQALAFWHYPLEGQAETEKEGAGGLSDPWLPLACLALRASWGQETHSASGICTNQALRKRTLCK